MKTRKTSEVLKYSGSGRLSLSEKEDSKRNLTINNRESVNSVLQFMKTELLSCTRKSYLLLFLHKAKGVPPAAEPEL